MARLSTIYKHLLRCDLQRFPILKYLHYVRHFPKLGSDPCGHSGAALQSLMNAHEIVVQEVDRHHVRVVVLFGSRARCDARKDSDYDIAVFIENPVTLRELL